MTATKELVAERLGGWGKMPPRWERITESEWLWRFSIKRGEHLQEFRQIAIDEDGVEGQSFVKSTYLWIAPDYSGIGFVVLYNGRATRSEIDAYKPLYFKWRWCDHEFRTTHRSNCYWEGECVKCGYRDAIDSSG
jgi:hypothetical protein